VGMGATNLPYKAENFRVRSASVSCPVKVGWLRSVCNIFHATAVNTVMDVLASKVGEDPIDYRLKSMERNKKIGTMDTERMRHVIEKARRFSSWNDRKKAGSSLGFANHYSFQSYVAMVVEVIKIDKSIQVKQVDVVADVGQVVHPEAVISQFEGSVIFGLTAALNGQIEIKDGAVVQSNFHDYPMLRMDTSPTIKVHLVDSVAPPEGVGEPGTPPVVPGVISAIHQLTGMLITELPIRNHLSI